MSTENGLSGKCGGTGERRSARLGLVLDQVIYERGKSYSTDDVFVRFVEQASRRIFDRVQLCSRARPAAHDGPYLLDPSVYEIVKFPWYENMPSLCLRAPILFPRIARVLAKAMQSWEMALIANVGPLAPLALRMARHRRLPTILWVRGNLSGDLKHRLGKRGPRRMAGMAVAAAIVKSLPSGIPVLSSGTDDYPFLSRMGPVQVVYSSKFGDEDFVTLPRSERSDRRSPHLLYVGRIAPEKGLDVLLDALCRRKGGELTPPVLTLVGSDLVGSTYGDAFRRRVEASELAEYVRMVGYVPYGERLFQIYDEHDVLVLPSFTEGFPQVLLEAMVRGLPVISTAVGGVPTVIRDGENGLLVPPGNPAALASALRRILIDSDGRARISIAGQQTARSLSRNVQVAAVEQFIRRCIPSLNLKREDASLTP